ncbi:MAG: DUF459 domain-containing protein [Myxococcales bacterium]|nr:DUF459 domain-containing protein [Myxococcales bacterium]
MAAKLPVVDKYKPVVTVPQTISPVGPTVLGAVFLAIAVALFSPQTFVEKATFPESPARWATLSAPIVEAGAKATGLGALRVYLDDALAPLDRVGTIFGAAAAPVPSPLDAAALADANVPSDGPVAAPALALTAGQPPGASWTKLGHATKTVRVLIVGASSIQHAVGTELERELVARYANVVVKRRGKAATGLSRPDVFDWPAETARLMREFKPDVVIGQFGGNDAQNIVDANGKPQTVGTDAWKAEYTRRPLWLVGVVKKGGATFYLLGLPAMKSDKFNRTQRMLDEVSEAAMKTSGAHFVPTYDLSVDASGKYRVSVKYNGESGLMRMSDGIHFTRLGGQYVAHHLATRLEGMLGLIPKPAASGVKPAQALQYVVPSAARGNTPLLAFVPVDVPAEGLPVWYLLHGADASYQAWSDNAHEELQRLAAEHQMIIVAPDGERFGWWLDATQVPTHRLQTWFLSDLVPWVDTHLPTTKRRAISGYSMGGHGAFTLAFAAPERFVAVTSLSGAVDLPHAKSREALQKLLGPYETNTEAWHARSTLHLVKAKPQDLRQLAVLFGCGEGDLWFAPNQALHAALTAAGVTHTWTPTPGGHTWDVWTAALPAHAAFVAQALRNDKPAPIAAN